MTGMLANNSTAAAAKGNIWVGAFMVESPFLILAKLMLAIDLRIASAGREFSHRFVKTYSMQNVCQ